MSNNITNGSNKSSGLRNSYLSSIEVLAQSIASIAPSATPALVIPLVFGFSGNGTWLAYFFGMIAIVLVGVNLNQFTKRSASPGNLYAFIVKGLGTEIGVISGWALVLAYILTASAVLCGFINYVNVLLAYVGVTSSSILIGILGALAAWYIAVKDIKLSARIMLAFEGISVALIILLAAIVLVKHGFTIDNAQFTLQGVSTTGLGMGLVLAFFSFAGFESATSLGDEAKNPLKTIPKAVTISSILVGVFFVLLSYTEILGFIDSTTSLNEAAAPLTDLSNFNSVSFFGPLISIGALISFWACFLACTNAGARILYLMGQHGVLNSSIGVAHDTNKTPHVAITISTILASVIPFILILNKGGLIEIYGWVGTIATYGFILAYALVTLSTPLYLYRENELKKHHIALSMITILVLMIPIVGSIYANASSGAPYSWFIYIFIGWLAVGKLLFSIRKAQSPDVGSNITEEIESVHKHFRDLRVDSESKW
ncbi:MAG TPA: APC family permease [Methanosarcina sp.]